MLNFAADSEGHTPLHIVKKLLEEAPETYPAAAGVRVGEEAVAGCRDVFAADFCTESGNVVALRKTTIRGISLSTFQEIKTAIVNLPANERALLTAELVAAEPEPDARGLAEALDRGMADLAAGRVRPISEVPALIREWLGKS